MHDRATDRWFHLRVCLGVGLAIASTSAPAFGQPAQQQAAPLSAPQEPSAAPTERRSTAMMVAGQVLTGFGVVSIVGGVGVIAWGMTSGSCKWGEEPGCNSTFDTRLIFIGVTSLGGGGGLGLGLGIPLWVKGARPNSGASHSPGLTLGKHGVGVAWTF